MTRNAQMVTACDPVTLGESTATSIHAPCPIARCEPEPSIMTKISHIEEQDLEADKGRDWS